MQGNKAPATRRAPDGSETAAERPQAVMKGSREAATQNRQAPKARPTDRALLGMEEGTSLAARSADGCHLAARPKPTPSRRRPQAGKRERDQPPGPVQKRSTWHSQAEQK